MKYFMSAVFFLCGVFARADLSYMIGGRDAANGTAFIMRGAEIQKLEPGTVNAVVCAEKSR
jgi:hypothetical protein